MDNSSLSHTKRSKIYKPWTIVTGSIVFLALIYGVVGFFYPIFAMGPGDTFPQIGHDSFYRATWTKVYYYANHSDSTGNSVQKYQIPGLTPRHTTVIADTFALNDNDGSVYFWGKKLDSKAQDLHVVRESTLDWGDAGHILYAYDNDYIYSWGAPIARREAGVDPYSVYLQYLDHTLPDFRG